MRQGGTETAPRFLKCRGLQGSLSGKDKIMDQFPLVSERARLEEVVRDVTGALLDASGIELLDRVGDTSVQSLLACSRDARKQGLTHQFMAEGKWPLRSLGARDNDSHPLRLLDDVEKIVSVVFADRGQQLKTETTPDHRGGHQHTLFILVEPLQPAADDQAHVFRNVDLIDLDVGAELAGLIIEFSILEQVLVQLL